MNAMVLAAGFGTRMRPLTDRLPKALLPIHGKPLLQLILNQLRSRGFDKIVVNAHHHAEQIKAFIEQFPHRREFELYFSYEPMILDTGGGIKKMLSFFPGDNPILVHNVDILSACDLKQIMAHHLSQQADATMVLHSNPTDRSLAFDTNLRLLGRSDTVQNRDCQHFGFCGIQVVQPHLFHAEKEPRFYSIDLYIRAAQHNQKIIGYPITGVYWRDIGRPEDVHAAEEDILSGRFQPIESQS